MTTPVALPRQLACRPHLPISEAQPRCQAQPDRAEPRSPRSGALDSAAKRSYRFHPPAATTVPECGLIPAAICGVKSDTRHYRPADALGL